MSNLDLLLAAIEDLKANIKEDTTEIKDHLRELNSRTRKVEECTATHATLWRLLGGAIGILIPLIAGVLYASG